MLCFICYCWERSKGGSLSLTIHFTCSIYTQDWCSIEDENSRFPPLQNVDSNWRPPRGDTRQRVNLEEEKKSAGCMWVEKRGTSFLFSWNQYSNSFYAVAVWCCDNDHQAVWIFHIFPHAVYTKKKTQHQMLQKTGHWLFYSFYSHTGFIQLGL